MQEKSKIQSEIDNLTKAEFGEIKIYHLLAPTMINGKVTSILTDAYTQ